LANAILRNDWLAHVLNSTGSGKRVAAARVSKTH
jgi:hypothetical protein